MSLLSRLFGSKNGKSPAATSVEYKGFQIKPEPMKESQGFRLCATIEKEVDGVLKTHRLIRADTIADFEQCNDASVAKVKQMIDQMGERLF